jgi:Ala-tRNA(Pro) deacylase
MALSTTLEKYLAAQGVDYAVVTHRPTTTSAHTAQESHVPGDRLAKAVIVKDEEGFMMAVVPASHHLQLAALSRLRHRLVGLATEAEADELFQDCVKGAFPALGSAYGLEVIVDDSLAGQPEIYFEGGDHENLVQVSGEQFGKLMATAEHARISHHD